MRTKRAFKIKYISIFHHFGRAIIEANKKIFFEREESDFDLTNKIFTKKDVVPV